jgi:hypothetical protein
MSALAIYHRLRRAINFVSPTIDPKSAKPTAWSLLDFSEVIDRRVKYLVPSGPNSHERRAHFNIQSETHVLKLPPVCTPNTLAAELHVHPSRRGKIGHVAVGALRRASDALRAIGCLEKQSWMLGLAYGALIYQHHRSSVVAPFVIALYMNIVPAFTRSHDLLFVFDRMPFPMSIAGDDWSLLGCSVVRVHWKAV